MPSKTHIVAFLTALLVAAIATPLIRRIAHRYGLYDAPSQLRKVHRRPTPRLGGVAIALGFFAPLTALLLYDNDISVAYRANPQHLAGLYLGGLLVLALGVVDDIRGVSAWSKLAAQVVVATVMYQFGFVIERLAIPFWGVLDLGFLSFPVTLLWFVGVMNVVNLIDGLDGLAGGVSFFAVAVMFIVSTVDGVLMTSLFSAALMGAIVGFLFYNFNPATIFMGDCGSLFLGFVIAAVGVKTQAKSSTALALTVPVLALGLPIVDAFLAIIRRLRRGKSVFAADKEHIHHRLLALGLTQRQAVLVLYALCGIFAAVAIAVKAGNDLTVGLALVGMAAVIFVATRFFHFQEMVHQRRMSMLLEDELMLPSDARVTVRGLARRVRSSASIDGVWEAVKEVADLIGVRDVSMRLYLRRDEGERIQQHYRWHSEKSHVVSRLLHKTLEVPLVGASFLYGEMSYTFRDGGPPDNEERAVLLHVFSEAVAEFIELRLLEDDRNRFVVSRLPARGSRSGGT